MSQRKPEPQFHFPGICAVALALALAACSSTPLSRIDSNRATYESWPIDVQEAVYHQRVIAGMTPAQVEMALGKPSSVDSRTGKDGLEEIWIYKKSSGRMPGILENTSIGLGGSIGGVGVGTSAPLGRGRSRAGDIDDQEIVFKNGVVIRGSS